MKYLLYFSLFFSLLACTSEPEPITYGKDYCQFCKMTIMEPQFAGELITKKGKVFKFDDVSCMVKYVNLENQPEAEYAFILINDYTHKDFVNVAEAHFVHDENIKSPMGGQTIAFKEKLSANNIPTQVSKDFKELNWAEIKAML